MPLGALQPFSTFYLNSSDLDGAENPVEQALRLVRPAIHTRPAADPLAGNLSKSSGSTSPTAVSSGPATMPQPSPGDSTGISRAQAWDARSAALPVSPPGISRAQAWDDWRITPEMIAKNQAARSNPEAVPVDSASPDSYSSIYSRDQRMARPVETATAEAQPKKRSGWRRFGDILAGIGMGLVDRGIGGAIQYGVLAGQDGELGNRSFGRLGDVGRRARMAEQYQLQAAEQEALQRRLQAEKTEEERRKIQADIDRGEATAERERLAAADKEAAARRDHAFNLAKYYSDNGWPIPKEVAEAMGSPAIAGRTPTPKPLAGQYRTGADGREYYATGAEAVPVTTPDGRQLVRRVPGDDGRMTDADVRAEVEAKLVAEAGNPDEMVESPEYQSRRAAVDGLAAQLAAAEDLDWRNLDEGARMAFINAASKQMFGRIALVPRKATADYQRKAAEIEQGIRRGRAASRIPNGSFGGVSPWAGE